MPLYEYKAYNLQGKTATGVIDAPSKGMAFEKLKQRKLHPYVITEDSGKSEGQKVKTEDLAFALEQLATLLGSGLPLTEALESLTFQVQKEVLKRAFSLTMSAVKEGSSFSSALAQARVFPPLLVSLVKASESVGEVESVLQSYSDYLKRQAEFLRKFITAITYPMIILVACMGLIFFMLTYIAPTLLDIFQNLKEKLPLSTRILLFTGTFLRTALPFLIGGAVFGVIAFLKLVPKITRDKMKLNLPMVGRVYQEMLFSRWAHTLALLHGGGVSLTQALEASRQVLDNQYLNNMMETVEKEVERGVNLAQALKPLPYVPSLLIQMVETGVHSGELEKLLNSASTFYEKEIDRRMSIFLQYLEPAMILIMGGIVGAVVISILLPIFEINQIIK